LPTTTSKPAGGSDTRSSGALMMRAWGCSSWAIRAETGSRSTPVQVTGSPLGVAAMNRPLPQPGSSTWPPAKPRPTTARQMAVVTVGLV
jgi:hypothetical protein